MLSLGSSSFGLLRFPVTENEGSGSSSPPAPNYTDLYNRYLKSLAHWAMDARTNRKYNDAKDAAAEVLVELGFSGSKEVLEAAPKEISAKIPHSLRPAAALALSVMARDSWTRTKEYDHKPHEIEEFRQRAFKLFSLACELDPIHVEHQRGFQNVALECRRSLSEYHGTKKADSADTPIDILTQSALESIKRFLTERFKFKVQTFDWVDPRLPEEERDTLSWALEQAATLAHTRATSLVHRDIQRSAGYTGQVLEFALGCFKSLGLPSEPRRFKDVHPPSLVRQGADQARIKRIMRVAWLLSTAYLAQREFSARDEADALGKRAAAAADSAPFSSRAAPPPPQLGERPRKPVRPKSADLDEPLVSSRPQAEAQAAVTPASTSSLSAASAPIHVSEPSAYRPLVVPPAPAAEGKTAKPVQVSKGRAAIQVSHQDWNALRSEIADSQPLTLRSDILNACTTQFVVKSGSKVELAFKNPEKFPADKFKSALTEFALDLDILKRGGAPAAALFVEEFSILLGDMLDDAIALIRLQVTASFIKNHGLVGPDRAHDLSELAKSCNKAIVALELRRDHGTAQKVFGPIVSAAVDGKLRS